jgi:hypothetical protein
MIGVTRVVEIVDLDHRFAGDAGEPICRSPSTSCPISSLFEEMDVLEISASFYIEFAQLRQGFDKWLLALAATMGGVNMSTPLSIIGNAAGQIFDAIAKAFSGPGRTGVFRAVVAMVPRFPRGWCCLSHRGCSLY